MKEKAKKLPEKKELSMASIQSILWDEIHSLRAGETSAANLSAITNASGKILVTIALQIKYAQLTGQVIDDKMLLFEKKD